MIPLTNHDSRARENSEVVIFLHHINFPPQSSLKTKLATSLVPWVPNSSKQRFDEGFQHRDLAGTRGPTGGLGVDFHIPNRPTSRGDPPHKTKSQKVGVHIPPISIWFMILSL